MTSQLRLERDLPQILGDLAMGPYPDYIDDVLAIAARKRQRPAWTSPERWIPMDLATRSFPTRVFPWRQLGVLALIGLLLAMALAFYVGSQRQRLPEPFGAAANGPIIYSDGGDIFARDTPDGAARLVVGGPEVDHVAGFSRQGTTLLIARDGPPQGPGTLWLVGIDGEGLRELSGEYAEMDTLDWSPSGDSLLITYQIRGYRAISIVPTDGGTPRRLDVGLPAMQATWRPPDGRQISFRGRDANGWAQYLINADGTGLQRLGLTSEGTFHTEYDLREATWSNDGRRLLYDTLETVAAGNGSGLRIHVAEIDAGGTVLKDTRYEFEATADDELQPRWMPQGDGIVYQRRLGNEDVGIVDSVRVATLIPGAPTTDVGIETRSGQGLGYEISPDGTQLIAKLWGENVTWVSDLTTFTSTKAQFPTDDGATWQRVAVP